MRMLSCRKTNLREQMLFAYAKQAGQTFGSSDHRIGTCAAPLTARTHRQTQCVKRRPICPLSALAASKLAVFSDCQTHLLPTYSHSHSPASAECGRLVFAPRLVLPARPPFELAARAAAAHSACKASKDGECRNMWAKFHVTATLLWSAGG